MAETIFCTRKEKWYNKSIFPLIPIIIINEADKYNTKRFTFHWLFFTFWSLDSFQFELAIVADTHWGIGFIGILPYIRWVITIPCPSKLESWVSNNLYRSRRKKHL